MQTKMLPPGIENLSIVIAINDTTGCKALEDAVGAWMFSHLFLYIDGLAILRGERFNDGVVALIPLSMFRARKRHLGRDD